MSSAASGGVRVEGIVAAAVESMPAAPVESSALCVVNGTAAAESIIGLQVSAPSSPKAEDLLVEPLPHFWLPHRPFEFNLGASSSFRLPCAEAALMAGCLSTHLRVRMAVSQESGSIVAEACEFAVNVVSTAAGWRVTVLQAPMACSSSSSSLPRLVVGPLMYARELVPSFTYPAYVRLGANHQPAPAGRVLKAVAAMQSTEVLEALLEGCSTEEKDDTVSSLPRSAHAGSATGTWETTCAGKDCTHYSG